ncbi:hypothetical protein [Nocardia wallacei]|uniref:hypothetical protein n=1 Tax=Nocardia wallacei TaxID=480035 RepID=UPI0024582B5A|nr:hypothetical protein [Nocardia wallacei]
MNAPATPTPADETPGIVDMRTNALTSAPACADYTARELRELMDAAADAVARERGAGDEYKIADGWELRLLRERLEALLGELRILGSAGVAMEARLTEQYPRLAWSRQPALGGYLLGMPVSEYQLGTGVVCDQGAAGDCARQLGLTTVRFPRESGRLWEGSVDDWHVIVSERLALPACGATE